MLYNNIAIALDCETGEAPVVREAIRLAKALKATLTVVHVNDPAAGKAHMLMNSLPHFEEADIRDYLRKLGFTDEADKVKVEIRVSEYYPATIAEVAQQADLLVIGHRRKNRFLAALIDTVDERVADLVSCPVLVVAKA